MTAPDLALAGADPAGFVLAVAELREARAKAATPGLWQPACAGAKGVQIGEDPHLMLTPAHYGKARSENAEHIAAEASPAHALAEVALWRGVVERHGGRQLPTAPDGYRVCSTCDQGPPPARHVKAPCPDLLAVVAAAKAYLGGAS